MSSTLLQDTFDTAMMDYDTHGLPSMAPTPTPDMGLWTGGDTNMDSDDKPSAPEVDMEADIFAEFDMDDDYDGAGLGEGEDVDIDVEDAGAAEAVAVDVPFDMDEPFPTAATGEQDQTPQPFASPSALTTPSFHTAVSPFFSTPAIPAPAIAVVASSEPVSDVLPQHEVLLPFAELPSASALNTPTVTHEPLVRCEPLPSPTEVVVPVLDSNPVVQVEITDEATHIESNSAEDAVSHSTHPESAPVISATTEVSLVAPEFVPLPEDDDAKALPPPDGSTAIVPSHAGEGAADDPSSRPEVLADVTELNANSENVTLLPKHEEDIHYDEHKYQHQTLQNVENDHVHNDEHTDERIPPSVLLTLSASDPDWLLFSASSVEPSDADLPLLLSERADLFFSPIIHVFEAMRVEEPIQQLLNAERGDLVLDAHDIDLTITEDNVYAREVTLHDLTLLHEGCGLLGPLRIRVYFSTSRFITRYQQLRDHVAKLSLGEAEAVETLPEDGEDEEEVELEQEVDLQEIGLHEDEAEVGGAEVAATEESDEVQGEDGEDTTTDDLPEDDGTGAYGTAVDKEYHQVSGAEAQALEGEDDYDDTLAAPNDDGTADPSELDADGAHEEIIAPGDDVDTEEFADVEHHDVDATEYEDVAGHDSDDEERVEDEEFFGDDAGAGEFETAGLGEVEDGVGISGEEREEQELWENALEDGTLPTFTPAQVAIAGGVHEAEKVKDETDDVEQQEYEDPGDVNAGLVFPADSSAGHDGAVPVPRDDLRTEEIVNPTAEGVLPAHPEAGPSTEGEPTDILETTAFDEPEDFADDNTSHTLTDYDDPEPEIQGVAIQEPIGEAPSRSGTTSSNSGISKRGFEEVDPEEEDGVFETGGSPGSKRARAV